MTRLNSRDYIKSRDRSTVADSNTTNDSFKISSIRIDPGAAVTVNRPTISEFGRSKSDHDLHEKVTFEIPKPVRSLHLPVHDSRIHIYLCHRQDANIIIHVPNDGQASEASV